MLSTQELLPLASVNRRLHFAVARLLHRRLLQVVSLPDYDLILECYHPSAKISTPYRSCRHLETVVRDGPVFSEESPTLPDLGRLYSTFRPVIADEDRPRRRHRPQQPLPGLLVMPDSPTDEDNERVTEGVYLDDGEIFTQLSAAVNLVKEGPMRGLFISHVNICDGVIRPFRQWLAKMSGQMVMSEEDGDLPDQDSILWVDRSRDVGLRFRVIPGPAERMPLLYGPEEYPPVSYTLVYEGRLA